MKTEYQIDIISKIKKLRESQGISQAKMASILGISTGQLGNIECYDKPHKYTLKQIVTICKTLNISIEKLFSKDDTENNISLDSFINYLLKYQNK